MLLKNSSSTNVRVGRKNIAMITRSKTDSYTRSPTCMHTLVAIMLTLRIHFFPSKNLQREVVEQSVGTLPIRIPTHVIICLHCATYHMYTQSEAVKNDCFEQTFYVSSC